MRPASRDCLSSVAAFNGRGREEAVAYLVRYFPGISPQEYGQFLSSLRNNHFDDSIGIDFNNAADYSGLPPPLRNALEALGPVDIFAQSSATSAVDAALENLPLVIGVKEQRELQTYAWALRRWAAQHRTVDDLLADFWRKRAVYANWRGFGPGMGITVTTALPPRDSEGVTVLLGRSRAYVPDHQLPNHVFFCPLEDAAMPSTCAAEC